MAAAEAWNASTPINKFNLVDSLDHWPLARMSDKIKLLKAVFDVKADWVEWPLKCWVSIPGKERVLLNPSSDISSA